MSNKTKAYLAIIAFLVGGLVIMTTYNSRMVSNSSVDTSNIRVYGIASKYVLLRLKSPSTAAFPGMSEKIAHVRSLGNDTYEVNSWVDAQNSFGAMIRNSTYVKLEYSFDNGTYRLLDIKIE